MAKRVSIAWSRLWDEFNDWYSREEEKGACTGCGRSGSGPDWYDQQAKIQELVLKHARERC